MSKFHKQSLLIFIFIILFAAILYFCFWNSATDEDFREPVNSIQQYGINGRVSDDYNSKNQSEKKIITGKKRVNILLLGIEGETRADTIMFISYDSTKSKLSIISIPRDTYFHELGYNNGDQRKINAVFGRNQENGCVEAVSKVLGDISIDYYVSIDYEGVKRIIDAIGGVEIEVPIDMEVGGIKITKGIQVLHGNEALQYLRFRKEYKDGDLGRIEAQQRLIKAALDKVQDTDLSQLVIEAFNSISTNMPLKYMNEYSIHFKSSDIKEVLTYILPGVPMYKYVSDYNWSYFFHNSQKVKELMNKIYDIESIEQKKRKCCEQ